MNKKTKTKLKAIYYIVLIKLIAVFSARAAALKAFKVFSTPYSGKPKRIPPAEFSFATPLTLPFEGKVLRGWLWQPEPEKNNGKKILIAHGFDSCSYRFAHFIQPFLQQGFTVIAFDAPAHELSDGNTTNVLEYRNAIVAIKKKFGPFEVNVGHSLGGMAITLAAEKLQDTSKLILIAPATETFTAIHAFSKLLRLNANIKSAFVQHIKTISNHSIHYFSVSRAIAHIHAPVLWIHDESDIICPFKNVLPVQEKQYPHISFYCTKSLGHSNIYRSKSVKNAIISFSNNE
ncbi:MULTISPECIES: alpha/beta fold hydrolase [Hydrotalea]|uniref:alpha/beta hydrolase n=1 Tax=Hydrotalea TaxID=1004300 RepID=UPI000941FC62|nr:MULTISPECIES: alpha/beta fold hydrolase [Hydrotalea]RWZ89816.1 MAG: alpha/beta fold hydrolase [Hydrotalea sp. AMD]